MRHQLLSIALLSTLSLSAAAAPTDQAYQELRGPWQVTELVDNGKVVPADSIAASLPSGGRIEFIDNAMIFTSTKDGQRHARVYALDATVYPRTFDVYDGGQLSGHGIYQFDDGRLVICVAASADAPRPTDFSARDGSHRVMMVLARADKTPVVAPISSATPALPLPPPPTDVRPLTDAEIAKSLPGTWKCADAYGPFYVTFTGTGVFSTYRETVETSAFQKVFRKLPLSSGTWQLKNGQVVLFCTSTLYPERLYKTFPFTVRSVNATDLVFVDYTGNVGKAVRQPF